MSNGSSSSRLQMVFVAFAAFVLAFAAASLGILGRQPAPDLTQFGSVLATLLFASAILERALDVGLSITFGSQADQMDSEIRKLRAQGAGGDAEKLKNLLGERTALSSRTRKWALPIALMVGILISAIGLRSLDPLFAPVQLSNGELSTGQQAFVFVDVLVTGMLLAGGSDGVHWLVALYRDWIEKNRSTKS